MFHVSDLQEIASLKRQFTELLSDIGFVREGLRARVIERASSMGTDGVLEATGSEVSPGLAGTRIHTHARTCIHIRIHTRTHRHAFTNTRAHTRIHTRVHTRALTHAHSHMRAFTHTHTRIHTGTHKMSNVFHRQSGYFCHHKSSDVVKL